MPRSMQNVLKKIGKKRKKKITVEVKKEIIRMHEQGMPVSAISKYYKKSASTICTVLKKKEELRELDVAKGVTRISKLRLPILEDVEKLLLEWINEEQLTGNVLTENVICRKAKDVYTDLVSRQAGGSSEVNGFKASRGWFENFKRRSGFSNIKKRGDALSSAEVFLAGFGKLMVSEGYLPHQVFNCHQTRLSWTNISKGCFTEESGPGLTQNSTFIDHISLLLSANACGDFKVKPLLVYDADNPRAFRKYSLQKNDLNVAWRSNNKAWINRELFVEWINQVFGPAVKQYLLENNFPLKAVLILNNAPAHPPDIDGDLLEEYDFIKFMFLPSNTTPLLEPMNKQLISNFKRLYIKELLKRCLELTEANNLTIKEIWKNHFHILNCFKIIDNAWNGVTKKTINSSWSKLWPDCVLESDESDLPVIDGIISLGRTLGLEMNEEYIQELVQEPGPELTTYELLSQHNKKDASEENDEEKEICPSLQEIRDICEKWEAVESFVKKHHPSWPAAVRAANIFNKKAMSHFREILEHKQDRRKCFWVVSLLNSHKREEFTDNKDSVNDHEIIDLD